MMQAAPSDIQHCVNQLIHSSSVLTEAKIAFSTGSQECISYWVDGVHCKSFEVVGVVHGS